MLVVMKFGGSSLADRDKIFRAARRCAKAHEQGKKVIVVLSAMGNTTDELLEQAAMMHPNPLPRELDMLLAVGEQISVAFMALALQYLEIPAVSLWLSTSTLAIFVPSIVTLTFISPPKPLETPMYSFSASASSGAGATGAAA